MVKKGFIAGYSDGTFKPNNSITRTEFLKLLFLVAGVNLSNDLNNYFSDIKVDWQKKYVNTAVNLGLVSINNKKFNPNGFLTKVEALKMATLLFVGELNWPYSHNLKDVSQNDWFSKYVEYSLNKDLLPVENNHFYPNKNITRYEVIGILSKLSKK